MVLHNDKWKWKNKRKHLKKVGEVQQNDSLSEESSADELITNEWRFEELKPIQHPKDEEQIALEREQRQIELEQDEANTRLVLEKLKLSAPEISKSSKHKDPKKMSKQELLDWSVEQQGEPEPDTAARDNRTLSEDEKARFYELQKRIERQKMVTSMKKKFATTGGRKVLEVTKVNDDNYKAVNAQRLEESAKKPKEGEFEESLADLLGDKTILAQESAAKPETRAHKITPKPAPSLKLNSSQTEDEFLDHLLG
ncbi:hypothetical protein KL918_001505 [Ogataea parapolymorpha]|uniref:Uncharacterized protein n=1 Tax=Ogataea parapolymorpha (strain ATCC 26012 / BCRC 20466 / JCM 22074 / NRRL Y-7560 / DL-1) TaxID=871575 RepID=W1QEX4_OGAPD|nr:hypothetical protein HPODL_03448 [Ogataea parapolymorpha DL-1]ESW99562.1 hypothetical protein HPODL_03448 [Ogataea parapolymorpha DL-1]KAG7868862.1 hypothetical protein KL918_001505 [Ogataea parapolymorpha]KAG7873943.1 hypothetical protein KL916_001717 [Ogataea parapolymorpha]